MTNRVRLFKRDSKGKILSWEISDIGDDTICLKYGLLGGEEHLETIHSGKHADKEIKSRVNAKRKNGYKAIGDLRDNAPIFISDSADMKAYLETYLPKINTTLDGDKFCMLCKTLEDNSPFEKHTYLGQYKINGERCIVHLEKHNDLFKPYSCRYTSRTGTDWTAKLSWMDEIIIPALNPYLKEMMLEENVALDGEMYIPGQTINSINSIIKNPEHPLHYKLQYWVYDLAVPNMSFIARHSNLECGLKTTMITCSDINEHLNNTQQILILSNHDVFDISHATKIRDNFIDLGFEGLVIRNIDAEYQFGGKRNLSMLKYKKVYDGYFEIIDIEPQSKKDNLPLFTLRNDINSECFQATINLPHKEQELYLAMRNNFIGQKAFVEYRERSGVKEVPFHAKITRDVDTIHIPIVEGKSTVIYTPPVEKSAFGDDYDKDTKVLKSKPVVKRKFKIKL